MFIADYVFLSTTLRTGPITTTNPHNFDTKESENLLCQVVVLSCFAVLVFTILLVSYCLNKRRISTWFSKCVGEELHDTQQNQTQDEEAQPRTSLQGPGEDEKALLSFENENRSRQDDVNGFDHCSFVRSKRSVNLPNSASFDCKVASSKVTPSVQALTDANKTDQNRPQFFIEDTGHGSEEETELKEIGEHADLAIGQNLSFASKIRAVEPSTQTATGAENLDHSYENTRNPDFDNVDENSRETDASENNDFDISNVTYEHNSNESAVSSNEDAADGNLSDDGDVDDDDGDDYDIGDGEDDDDYDDEEEEEDDVNEEDEESRVRITEGDHLLDNVDNANHIPNKTRNTVSSKNGGILRVTTEINIREV